MLPAEIHEHQHPCPACQGSGLTGERYTMPAGDYVLVIDVLCLACGGCGKGDPDHADCEAGWHADPDDEHDEPGEPACWSCGSGRGWYPVQGFTGEGDDMKMRVLRMPCGCSESRLVPADPVPAPGS
jgi:hypothetical protein